MPENGGNPWRWKRDGQHLGMVASFAEGASADDVIRAVIPQLDNALRAIGGPGTPGGGCPRCDRADTGLRMIVGALFDWQNRNPAPESGLPSLPAGKTQRRSGQAKSRAIAKGAK